MPNSGCSTLVLDESKYPSPMPLIGLYIAAGSLVCFLAIVFDVLSALRRRKRWIPCRLFSLNSVTLTLLGIAAKLPVDLTAAMPSTLDQFSKLTGMVFVCISMGFLMPSLGMCQNSECISNLIALTILVVTLIVNICIQIHTRVIFLFVTEHIIIMICMFGVLLTLWSCFLAISAHKSYSLDSNKDVVRKGEGSMLERLKLSYLYGFDNNPQFVLCKKDDSLAAGLGTICSVVLLQAAFRNLGLDFCRGKSDYNWSMWVIVLMQTLTILVGCLAICWRFMTSALLTGPFNFKATKMLSNPIFDTIITPGLRLSRKARCTMLASFAYVVVFAGYCSLAVIPMVVLKVAQFITARFLKTKYKENEEIEAYKHLIHQDEKGLEEWVLVRGVREMKSWIDICRSSSSNHLVGIFSETVPYPESCNIPVSNFSMVLLVKIAQSCIPPEYLSQTLLQTYDEAREILHFIEDRTKSKSSENKRSSEIAKALWRGKGFRKVFVGPLEMPADGDPLEFALAKINDIKEAFDSFPAMDDIVGKAHAKLRKEIFEVANFLTSLQYTSVEDLNMQIQQEFVHMMHSTLSQLPHAIYKEIVESSAEYFHESVRLCLGIMCKLEALQSHICWSFPVESHISQLWQELPFVVPGHSQSKIATVHGISQAGTESLVTAARESQCQTHIVDIYLKGSDIKRE